jgi:hypothetical protein
MNSQAISHWLQIGANVGILIGLVLVALQIQQSTDIARAQIINDYYIADLQLELTMMGEQPQKAWTKAVFNPDDLTTEDAVVVDRYVNYNFIQLARLEQMRSFGLADDRNRADMMAWHLGNPVGRRWWEYVKSHHWYGRGSRSLGRYHRQLVERQSK